MSSRSIISRRLFGHQKRVGWIDLSGFSVSERLAVEDTLLHQQEPSRDQAQQPSCLVLVGHHQPDRYNASSFGNPLSATTTSIWTTLMDRSATTTTPPVDQCLALHQDFLQSLEVRQQTTATKKPQKTLIMESKACCGIGVSGKILDLQEIQSKQQQLRANSNRSNDNNDDDDDTCGAPLRLTLHNANDQHRHQQLVWDNQLLASCTETITSSPSPSWLFRTSLAWHVPANSTDDDEHEELLFLADLFPSLQPSNAVEAFREVMTTVGGGGQDPTWQPLEDVSLDDILATRNEPAALAATH